MLFQFKFKIFHCLTKGDIKLDVLTLKESNYFERKINEHFIYQKKDVLEAPKILFTDCNTQIDFLQFQKYYMKFLFLSRSIHAKHILC